VLYSDFVHLSRIAGEKAFFLGWAASTAFDMATRSNECDRKIIIARMARQTVD